MNMRLVKTIIVFLVLTFLFKQFEATAQKRNISKLVTLQGVDSSLSYFLEEINQQASINFAINLERVNIDEKITLNIQNKPVSEVLKKFAKPWNWILKFLKTGNYSSNQIRF